MVLTVFTVAAVVDGAATPVSGESTSAKTPAVAQPILTVAYTSGFVPQETLFTNYERPVGRRFRQCLHLRITNRGVAHIVAPSL